VLCKLSVANLVVSKLMFNVVNIITAIKIIPSALTDKNISQSPMLVPAGVSSRVLL
jgi:hypothetical protein